MFELIMTVISSKTYTDSNALLDKIKRLWVQNDLTDEQYETLTAAVCAGGPVKEYALQEEIDRIWAAVHELQRKLESTPAPENDTVADFVQPTGAHDAYQTGDRMRFHGTVYESLIDGNVWSPDVYPAGWKEVTE